MIYEYKCQKCGELKEFNLSVQEYSDINWEDVRCSETCDGELSKVWSDTPVHYKGHGWTVRSK